MQRTNWTKRMTIMLAAICIALVGLSGFAPGSNAKWLLQVNGTPISHEEYSYFLAQELLELKFDPAKDKLDKEGRPKDMAALRKDVAQRCSEYVTINEELKKLEKPMDQLLKKNASLRSTYLWRLYGTYYTSLGITKATVHTIQVSQSAREQLFAEIYDIHGTKPTAEADIQAYFYGNYVAYDGIRVLRTTTTADGQKRDMTPAEIASLKKTMQNMVDAITNADDFYSVAQQDQFAGALGYGTPSTSIMRKGDVDVSAEDFEKVRSLSADKVMLLEMPDAFLVAKGVNMRNSPDEYYNVYRNDCLWALKGGEYDALLKELGKSYRADENVREVNRLLKKWDWAR